MFECEVTKINNEEISINCSLDDIKDEIINMRPVILRGILTTEEAKKIREISFKRGINEKQSLPKITNETPNYNYINIKNPKSVLKKILHIFTYFYWNADSQPVETYFRRMYKLRNKISGLKEDFALDKIEDGFFSIPIVQHYPRGGGFLQEHTDPDDKSIVVVNTILSSYGKDWKEGGLYYRNNDGIKIYVDSKLNLGDAFLFNPKTRHGIDPIDPNIEMKWDTDEGRWMCFSALITVAGVQGKLKGTPKPIGNYSN